MFEDPSLIDLRLDSRAITFENMSGARGAGGSAHGGRKGAPSRTVEAGTRLVLADIEGPGTVRHTWMTFPPAPPEVMRAAIIEVFYDGRDEPSISVPALDFFGMPHGRPVAYHSALTAAQEGRGFNAYFPMPFRRGLRLEFVNGSARPFPLYFQVDYTAGPVAEDVGYLHVSFARENPTRMRADFVIAEGLRGPGRFLGCVVGVRVLDEGAWYGEGEVKVFRDGDVDLPTICGTGLEDYVGSAWGMGPHAALYGGAPLEVRPPVRQPQPDFVGFYRWHVPDPIVFERELRVTIQQIGFAGFASDDELARYEANHPVAGAGWDRRGGGGRGIAERVDDYSAAAFVYCRAPQSVARVDLDRALRDIERLPYERAMAMERMFWPAGA